MGTLGETFWVTLAGLSDCGSEASSRVPVVTGVLVSHSSLFVISEALVVDSGWEIVEPQFFLCPESVEPFYVENQANMSYGGIQKGG